MRTLPLFALLLIGAPAAAAGHRAGDYARAMAPFDRAFARSCPAKRLDLLAPAELRDVLEGYAATAPGGRAQAMAAEEARFCARSFAGATCPNVADLRVARRQGFTRPLADLTCQRFAGCTAQSDCTPAR